MRTKLTIKHPRPASPSRAPVRSGSLVARKPTRPAAPPEGAPKPKSKSKPSANSAAPRAAKPAGAGAVKPRAPREADRPSRSEARPARDGERPFRSEGRPARDRERPVRSGARPPRDGERPFRSEGRPARDGERPVRSGARPPRDGERPFRSEGRPARDGERPARNGARPPRDGERPFRSEGRPARDGERPVRSGARPPRDGERPFRSEGRPARDGERPVRSGARPPRDGERPLRGTARPVRDGERPVRAGTRPPRDGDRPSRVESRPARDTDRPARKPRVTTERPAPSRLKVAQPVKARPSFDSGDEAGMMRLSKRMSELGLCSRREADEWIEKGWVLVDGERIDTLGTKVRPDQKIEIDDQAIAAQAAQVTILLHKPVGYVSGQAEDGYEPAVTLITRENHWSGDRSALRLSPLHLRTLAPAGRLDIDSTGLLVLTQDGRIAKQLIGEQSDIDKEYLVRVRFGEHVIDVDQHFPAESLAKLRHGLELDGVPLKPAMVSWQNSEQLRFVLREGKKRQIRRMCELVGLEVVGLKRVRMGRVMLGALPQGQWRYLGADETF
ncbi:pseudouridine synthase [Burkholderia glumae]|uniref:pseudouridine synthase n=1 Tax=Burkholderia glumae TaxID=337 RepID=UPI000C274A89|nr:pseudouridine synthase [Burkholderia glumae]PJO23470.1 pseudouridine synthase [Burkholderia glumae AU6208]QHE11599.1 pseudouridine synthase [Burkholderia glumae AU6208]